MPRSPAEPPVVARCHGVRVPDSPLLTPERIARIEAHRYEGPEIAGALRVVRPGDRVLELGAGLGLVGAVVAHQARPERVLSFEANPELLPHITALHRLNGLEDRIRLENAVLVSDPEAPPEVTFHLRSSYLGSSLLNPEARPAREISVPTRTWAEVMAQFRPDVLLMDIEGGELALLEGADLSGLRAIVLEFHPDTYGKQGMRRCKAILERAGFAKVPGHCSRTVWTLVHDPALSAPQPEAGWSREITTLQGATVVPPTETGFVQPAGLLRADGSHHPGGALWRNGRALTEAPPAPEGEPPLRSGTWLWGGLLWMHFGHFLVESSARLWALDHLKEPIAGILYIPKRPRNGAEVVPFQKDFLRLLGQEVPLLCLAAPERVERLIVPGQGFGLGSLIEGTPEYRHFMRSRFAAEIPPEGPERLYISRSDLPAGRGNLIGEAELEAHLAAQGYEIYHPERHGLAHQVARYKAARQVIAAEGSALHLLAMVAPPEARVACIVRRPSGATRNIERHLASFTGSPPLMVTRLTRSWKPRGKAKPRLWMGELDMPGLQAELTAAGFLAAAAPWAPLDPGTVRARLGKRFEEVA